jgi:hypothetical protein
MATTGHEAGIPRLRKQDWTGEPASLPVSRQELARSMTLLRASNLSVVRLQLAMERQDKRQAMEALDGLVALDGEIRELVGAMPAEAEPLREMTRRIDDQRSAIASEKLVFAAGRRGPALARHAEPAAEPAPVLEEAAAPDASEAYDALEEAWQEEAWEESGRRRAPALILALLFMVAAIGAATLHLAGIDASPLPERLQAWMGDL